MKKAIFISAFILVSQLSKAQLDFSNSRIELAGNYTMYRGDFGQNTPGAKIRFSVPTGDRFTVGLGFTYSSPIKEASTVSYNPSGSVPSELVFNFKTISLEGNYYFGGENENGFNAYGMGGVSLVLVNYKENLKGTPPSGGIPIDLVESTSENGFTINLGLGAQYSLGRPKIFGEAQIAIPANQVNGQFVENVIPGHFIFNVGIRFALGNRSDY